MKSHALAQKAHVEFFADVALHALGDDFGAEVPSQLQDPTRHLRRTEEQGQAQELLDHRPVAKDHVERLADDEGHGRSQEGITEGSGKHDQHEPPVEFRCETSHRAGDR